MKSLMEWQHSEECHSYLSYISIRRKQRIEFDFTRKTQSNGMLILRMIIHNNANIKIIFLNLDEVISDRDGRRVEGVAAVRVNVCM